MRLVETVSPGHCTHPEQVGSVGCVSDASAVGTDSSSDGPGAV